jgi:AcrR family transcriptional regulator
VIVRQWIPVSTSPKGRLALRAVALFGARPFDEVTVGELATAADVTTGAIYHHFGSKRGLYSFVLADVEQRLIDRLEGALAARASVGASAAISAALEVGFDFAVRESFLRLLGAAPVHPDDDRVARLVGASVEPASPVLGRILAAAWREALTSVAEGVPAADARAALGLLQLRV